MAAVDLATYLRFLREQDARDVGLPPGFGSMVRAVDQVPGAGAVVPRAAVPEPVPSQEELERRAGLSGQPNIDEIIRKLFPDVDYEAEAERVLAKRGLTRPTAPKDLKMTPWVALAALGPALGAIFGGAPGMAASGAAAVLGGWQGSWAEADKAYREQAKEYTLAAGDLSERMAQRGERRAALLIPYLAMSAKDRLDAKINIMQLGVALKGLSLQERSVLLQASALGLQKSIAEENARRERRQQEIEILKAIDAKAAAAAQLAFDREKEAWDRQVNLATISLQKGNLDETVRHNRAQERIEAAKLRAGGSDDVIRQIKEGLFLNVLRFTQQGLPLTPKMEAGLKLFGIDMNTLSVGEKAAVQNLFRVMSNAKATYEMKEVAYNAALPALAKQNLIIPPPTKPDPGFFTWERWKSWFMGEGK